MKAHIAHQIPGRIRFKIHAAKGNPALLEETRQAFAGIPGVHHVTIRPESGSILLHYDHHRAAEFEAHLKRQWEETLPPAPAGRAQRPERPGDKIEKIAHEIEEEAEFLAGRSHSARAIVDFFKEFDRQVKRASDNTIDLKILLALGLAIVTFLEIGAGAATPMWVTLALFALNHFLEIHETGAPAAAAGAPRQPGSGAVRALA